MKRRRIALIVAAIPVLLLALLLALPWLLRDRIETRVRAEINRRLSAQVAWGRVGLSILRDFPDVTLRLDDVSVTGSDRFAGDTLFGAARLAGVLDLGSVLRNARGKGPIVIRSIELDHPSLWLLVLEDGTANWNIVRPAADTARTARRGLSLTLKRFAVRDGRVGLDNLQADLHASVTGLTELLSGDFAEEVFALRTETSADSVSVRFAGVPYLSNARVVISAAVDADRSAQRFTLRDNEIRLNHLVLKASGSFAPGPDSTVVDVAFSTPATAFADILSLVPALYTRSFSTLQTAGTMSVSGHVRGGVGGGAFPAFTLDARVADGMFRYPDLPLPARDISFALSMTNPGGSADSTVVSIDRLHALIGSDPLDGSFTLRTPVSDPDVAVRLRGRVELANVGRTVKLERIDELAGTLVADAAMRARRSDVNAKRYERVGAEGTIELKDFAVRGPAITRPFFVEQALLRLSPRHAELVSLRGRSGNSDAIIAATLDNLLGFLLHGEVLRGQARITSTHVDLNEWRSDEDSRAVPVPRNVDFAVRADVSRLTYGTLEMRNARGALTMREKRATLDDVSLDMLGGTMSLSGFYETIDPARPTFDIDFGVSEFDVPAAFASLASVRAFAPVARYAQGRVSADLELSGALGSDLAPILNVLTGLGSIRTTGLVLKEFPAFGKLADALKLQEIRNPALRDLQSTVEIDNGKLRVRPFDVRLGAFTMNVQGSNGIDQSLDYQLALEVPRSALGAEANRAIAGLVSRSGRAGVDLAAADVIALGVRLTGTVTDPTVQTDVREATRSAARAVAQELRAEAAGRAAAVEQKVDSAAAAARQRAEAEAARVIAEAEERAATMRAEAHALAERVKQEGYARADSLVARATTPLARVAARTAADRLKQQTDEQSARIIREADAKADTLVAGAKRRAAGGG